MGVRMTHSCSQKMRAQFWQADPNCQVHTQQVSLQCLSTENIPLSQTTMWWQKWSELIQKINLLAPRIDCSEERIPKNLPRWVFEWNSRAFTVWAHCFCQPSPVGKIILNIFPCRVLELRIHTWNKQNLSMKEVVWTDCSLCGDCHIHTMHFEASLF